MLPKLWDIHQPKLWLQWMVFFSGKSGQLYVSHWRTVCHSGPCDRTAAHVIELLPMFYRDCTSNGECAFAQPVNGHGNCNGAVIFTSSTSLMTGIQQNVVTVPGNTVSTWPDLTRLHYDTFVNPIIASNSCKLAFSQNHTHLCFFQSCSNLLADLIWCIDPPNPL